jgi:hypothetical protein
MVASMNHSLKVGITGQARIHSGRAVTEKLSQVNVSVEWVGVGSGVNVDTFVLIVCIKLRRHSSRATTPASVVVASSASGKARLYGQNYDEESAST